MHRILTAVLIAAPAFVLGATLTAARQQTPAAATRREPQFENEQVRVWKSVILPRQPLALHRHDHGRTLIALTDGRLDVVDGTGKLVDRYDWKRGRAYWLPADPPGVQHGDINVGTEPVEVIVVELKRDR